MVREIYEVNAKIVDANGTMSTLNGYPKTFDSKSYSNDPAKARQRAVGEWHEVMGAFAKRDDRQEQLCYVIRIGDGEVVVKDKIGKISDVFAVTVTNGTGSGTFNEGRNISIVADEPAEGKQFSHWQGADDLEFVSGDVTTASATFTMPALNVALEATYEDVPEPEPEEEEEP